MGTGQPLPPWRLGVSRALWQRFLPARRRTHGDSSLGVLRLTAPSSLFTGCRPELPKSRGPSVEGGFQSCSSLQSLNVYLVFREDLSFPRKLMLRQDVLLSELAETATLKCGCFVVLHLLSLVSLTEIPH